MPTLPPSINYFNSTYRQDKQSPIAIHASTFTNHQPVWEAVGVNNEYAGTFTPRLDTSTVLDDTSDTVFKPANRTQPVTVRVYNALRPSWTNISTPISMVGDELSYTLSGGTPGSYYGVKGVQTFSNPGTDQCFIEARADGPMIARSIGFSAASTPSYGWDNIDYNYALVLGQIGQGSIWVNGASVMGAFSTTPGFTYEPGDLLRVDIETNKIRFRKNGVIFFEYAETPPSGLQPIVSFAEFGAIMTEVRFWQTSYLKAETPMQVWGVMPVSQDKLSEHEVLEVAEVSEAEAQRGQDKVVRYHQQQDKWDLVFSSRRLSELQEVRDLRAFHRLHIPFYLADNARGIDKLVVFDTGVKDRMLQSNMFDFSCTVKEY
jgi:hypothetical protein